jgi:hypothetical protein
LTGGVTPEVPGNVRAFRRPPVRQATLVRSAVGHTFDIFVRTMAFSSRKFTTPGA